MPQDQGPATTPAPSWDEALQRLLQQMEQVLPPAASVQAAEQRQRYLARVTTTLLRFGTDRTDPIPSMLAHLGNYWSCGILITLRVGPLRHSALQKLMALKGPSHPISKRMLMINLRALEQDGLVSREVHDSRRPHVEYRLTALGHGLCEQLLGVIEWGAQHAEEIKAARVEPPAQPPAPAPTVHRWRFKTKS